MEAGYIFKDEAAQLQLIVRKIQVHVFSILYTTFSHIEASFVLETET